MSPHPVPVSGAFASRGPVSGAYAQQVPLVERYTCLDRLGIGGMGHVWRAHDQRLRRDVALKTTEPGAPEEHLERLRREGRIATRLALPGVVRVFDQGHTVDGRLFLVMELLQTPALGRGRAADIELLRQVAHTMGEVHRHGVVHRDLKPSNLALRGDQAVILDWGLARPLGEVSDGTVLTATQAPLTRTGVTLGTPGYMAPEQVSGNAADPRSDVWSLCAMLHEVATGMAAHGQGGHRLLAQLAEGRFQPPPGALGDVIARGLSLDPEARFPDAVALSEALDAALAPPKHTLAWRAGVVLATLALCLSGAFVAHEAQVLRRFRVRTADLHADHGWLLARQGRMMEARRQGQAAEDLQSTPEGRGLLLLPEVPQASVEPHGCQPMVVHDGSGLSLCGRDDTMVLFDKGTIRWERAMPRRAWVGRDRVALHDDWSLRIVDPSGRDVMSVPRRHIDAVHVAEEVNWVVWGDEVVRLHPDEPALTFQVPGHTPDGAVTVGDTLVLHQLGELMAVDENGPRHLLTFGEPMVYGRHIGSRVVLVGLRGLVVFLDARTLEVTSRYRLNGVTQLVDAAWDGDALVVSRRDGVFVYRGSQVEHQLSDEGGRAVHMPPNDDIVVFDEELLWRWSKLRGAARGLITPAEDSTTALGGGHEPSAAVGRHLYLIEPELLLSQELLPVEQGPVRDVVMPGFVVDAGGLYRVQDGVLAERIGTYPVATRLVTGEVVGARRWNRGVVVAGPDTVVDNPESPIITRLATEHGGTHALGRTREGGVVRISRDARIEPLPFEGVDRIASGPLGLFLTRGSEIELVGGWTVDAGQHVTALATDHRFLVAGLINGELRIYDAEGEMLYRMQAHGELVSDVILWRDWLLSASWEPGIRRWRLPQEAPRTLFVP